MEHPPLQPTPVGAFRFNTDSSKMEYYDGNQWVNITSTSPEAQTGGTRGFIAGGYTNAPVSAYGDISYFNVDTIEIIWTAVIYIVKSANSSGVYILVKTGERIIGKI